MTKLEKIEQDIKALGEKDMARLRDWFAELQADQWDEQIECDVNAGKLDKFAEQALANHKAGRTTAL